jgi:hypothetical protein
MPGVVSAVQLTRAALGSHRGLPHGWCFRLWSAPLPLATAVGHCHTAASWGKCVLHPQWAPHCMEHFPTPTQSRAVQGAHTCPANVKRPLERQTFFCSVENFVFPTRFWFCFSSVGSTPRPNKMTRDGTRWPVTLISLVSIHIVAFRMQLRVSVCFGWRRFGNLKRKDVLWPGGGESRGQESRLCRKRGYFGKAGASFPRCRLGVLPLTDSQVLSFMAVQSEVVGLSIHVH